MMAGRLVEQPRGLTSVSMWMLYPLPPRLSSKPPTSHFLVCLGTGSPSFFFSISSVFYIFLSSVPYLVLLFFSLLLHLTALVKQPSP